MFKHKDKVVFRLQLEEKGIFIVLQKRSVAGKNNLSSSSNLCRFRLSQPIDVFLSCHSDTKLFLQTNSNFCYQTHTNFLTRICHVTDSHSVSEAENCLLALSDTNGGEVSRTFHRVSPLEEKTFADESDSRIKDLMSSIFNRYPFSLSPEVPLFLSKVHHVITFSQFLPPTITIKPLQIFDWSFIVNVTQV